MKKKNGSLILFISAAIVMALAMVAEQIVVYLNYYSFEDMLWHRGTPTILTQLVYIMVALTALFAAAAAVTVKGCYCDRGLTADDAFSADSRLTRLLSLLVGLALVALPIAQLCVIGSSDHLNLLLVYHSPSYQFLVALFHVLTLLLALPSAFFFVRRFLGKKRTLAETFPFLLFLTVFVLRVYFDMTVMLNNPRRLFSVVTLLAMVLYTLCEARLLFEPKRIASYTFVAVLAMVTSAASGFSNLFLNLIGCFADGAEVVYYLLEAVFSVYVASKLFALVASAEKVPADSADPAPIPSQEAAAAENVSTENASLESRDEEETEDKPLEDVHTASTPDESTPPDITREELTRFYNAVQTTVFRRRRIDASSSEEERRAAKEETMQILSGLLNGDNRSENIQNIRTFLSRIETEPGESEALPE